MRVASPLPSATETLFALDVKPVGVSHSRDHPPAARELPTLTSTVVDHADRSAADIDAQTYEVDVTAGLGSLGGLLDTPHDGSKNSSVPGQAAVC